LRVRKLIVILIIFLAVTFGWYVAWRAMLSADVARVKTSIAFQDQRFKTVNRFITFKANAVQPSGFPFHFRVVVKRPTLTMISGQETYAVSVDEISLTPVDSGQGRYRVSAPATVDALYAVSGGALENYRVTLSSVPALLLRAQGDSRECMDMPGSASCADVAADAPLISFAVQMPASLTLHATLNSDSRDIGFTFTPLNIPLFATIPANIDGPLQIFVGMLREALVYHTK
jgi:hypothetical protein